MQNLEAASSASPVEESSSPAIRWGPIFGGAVAASAASIFLVLLGSGLGLSVISPWPSQSVSLTTFAASAAVWLVVVQWLSSAIGGYLAGRLRTKWVGVHTDEVFFRDTAHGFLSWALATVFVIGILVSAIGSAVGTGVKATASAASGASAGVAAGAAKEVSGDGGYFIDTLFRPGNGASVPSDLNGSEAVAAQAARILANAALVGEMPAEDKAYLARLVAAKTGLAETDAQARVDAVLRRVAAAKADAEKTADTARKTGLTVALVGALSLLIGAFVASAAAAYGGMLRDDEEMRLTEQSPQGL
ncbi:hypothetical protein [Mesorhizobium sp. ANAO-SY3R2]|uniref:hypothetical protein n=1 Tax=Mesorhizobium sp. ANAO-SY3R2 TaxID=3166644 RepID=UPI00367138E9